MEEISLGSGDGEPSVDYGSVAEDEERQRRQQALTFEDEAADQHRRKRRKRANAADAVTFDNEEDVSRHQALILQLTRFGSSDRFGAYLKSLSFQLTPAHLKTLQIDELEECLQRVRCACMNKGSSEFFTTAALAVCQGVEVALTKSSIPVEAHGFTEMLKKDEVGARRVSRP